MAILHTFLASTTLLLCACAAPVLDSVLADRVLGSVGTASNPAILRLSKKHVHSPPRSRVQALLTGMTGNGSSIPANGAVWPTAIYWTKVQIGTPPVDFPVAIDSGSGDLDVSGKGCKGCVTTEPNVAYDHTKSSTSKRAFPFSFSNTYQTCDLKDPTAGCTISGPLFKDAVSLAGLGPVEVTVGSIGYQTSNFDQFKEIDGVMGFTMGTSKNVFASLVAAGKADNVWAMCFYEGQNSNGTITIGGVDPRLSVNGTVDYVDDVGGFGGFHSVEVASMQLGTTTIPVGKAAILDTGTNVLLAPKSVLSALSEAMCADSSLAHCSDLWSNQCVDLTDAQVAAYPPLSMSVGEGVTLHMSSQDYLLKGSPLAKVAGQYCIGIRDAGGDFIIGDTTMRNYYLVFDLAEKKIGWGKVNKDMCGSI